MNGRVKRAAEKLGISGEVGGKRPSVANASVDSVSFMRRLKPPPPSVLSFSASCKARALHLKSDHLSGSEPRPASLHPLKQRQIREPQGPAWNIDMDITFAEINKGALIAGLHSGAGGHGSHRAAARFSGGGKCRFLQSDPLAYFRVGRGGLRLPANLKSTACHFSRAVRRSQWSRL
jgi:hypothetical protein